MSSSGRSGSVTELTPKERSLITVAALTTSGNTDQLSFHIDLATQNGASEAELVEVITHLAFYAGWPKASAAMAVAKMVLRGEGIATWQLLRRRRAGQGAHRLIVT